MRIYGASYIGNIRIGQTIRIERRERKLKILIITRFFPLRVQSMILVNNQSKFSK